MSTTDKTLKRLAWMQSYATTATTTADGIYRRVKSTLPPAVVARAESIAAPVLTQATDAAVKALHLADEQVDYVVTTADKTYSSGKQTVSNAASSVLQIHETNLKTFSETSRAYYTWVQEFADWAKERVNPIKGGQAALDTLLAAMAKAKEASDPDVAAKMATDAWASFAALPLVAKLLDTADPVTRTALTSFNKLHDTLVGMTVYKRVVDTGASTLTWATSTSPYKLGATYIYPLVQPVADPALSKLAGSKVINDTLAYWKPAAVVA